MSIDSFSVFQLTQDTDAPPNQITTELNSLRTIITKKFYNDLTSQQKIFFNSFLWETLHGLASHSAPSVRLASSSVIGHILIHLSPFFYNDLLNSLLESIKKINEGSYIYLTSFVYLSKFLSASVLNQVLSDNPQILDLFSKASSEHLPNLVGQLENFSNEYLVSIVDSFIQGALNNPTNRHLPKAAAVLISKSIDNYSSILSNSDLPLPLISSLFPDRFPNNLESDISFSIFNRAIETIKSENSLPTDYEAACKIVFQLISGNFVDKEIISEQITEKNVSNSPNLTALLMLPVDEKIINKLYPNIDAISSDNENEKSKINPLLNYFSLNYKPEFSDKLIQLISKNLTPLSDSYSFALKVLGCLSSSLSSSTMNELLFKAFSINTSNWIHKLWTLELISKLDFKSLSNQVSDRAFEVINLSSTSKTDKLTQVAKEVTVKIFDTCPIDIFKIFIDEYCQKIDIFDQSNFELRISFLSYVFRNTPRFLEKGNSQENWTFSFTRLATLLYETINFFNGKLSATVMMNFFNIIECIGSNLEEENSQIMLLFMKKALDIIEPSYNDFCGKELGLKRPQILASNFANSNTTTQLIRVDTDLTSSPDSCHTNILQSALAAFSMIANIQISLKNTKNEIVQYLYNLANKLLPLFPSSSNDLIITMINMSFLTKQEVDNFINKSLKYSKSLISTFKIAKLLQACIKRFKNVNLNEYTDFNEYKQSLKIILPSSKDLDYSDILPVQAVLEYDNNSIPEKIITKIIKKTQLHLISGGNNENSLSQEDSNIFNSSLLYGNNNNDEDEIDTSSTQYHPVEANGFLLYVSTLSPFFYKHVEIPSELLQPALLRSFFKYSTVKINLTEANFLLKYCLENTNENCIRSFILYLSRNKIQLDIDLSHPSLQKKKIMAIITGYLKINSLPNSYVTSVLKTNDLVGFVLNASTKFTRVISISLIKIDPRYFMDHFKTIEKFHYSQIYNLCYYMKENVEFPPDEFYKFSIMLISKYINSRKKKNIVRRLLTLFVYKNLKNNSIIQEASALLNCDIGPRSNIEYVRKLSDTQIIELYYELIVINKVANCKPNIETLFFVLTKSTAYGMNLYLSLKQQLTIEDVNSLITTSYPQFQLPSLQTLPYRYLLEMTKNAMNELQSLKDSESLSQLPGYQIYKLLFTNFSESVKTNIYSFSFSRNEVFGFFLFQFINTSFSLFAKTLAASSNLTTNCEFIIKLVKEGFAFVLNNFEFKANSSYIPLFLQFYNTYLALKIEFDLADIEIIRSNVELLFDKNLVSILPMTTDVVIKLSIFKKDPNYATNLFSSYLYDKESYDSFIVSERASKFLLSIKDKVNKEPQLKPTKSKKVDKTALSVPLTKSSSSGDFIHGSDNKSSFRSAASSDLKTIEQNSIDPASFVIFGKSFFDAFCAFCLIKSQTKKEITYQNLIGKFTKRHEKSIITYFDRTTKPFSVLFAAMGDEKDKSPKILSSYINSFHDLLLVNHSEKKYNVF